MKVLVTNLYGLAGDAKTAHWNIAGSRFYGLHKLLDEVDEISRSHGDKFAERMRYHGEYPTAFSSAITDNTFMVGFELTADYEEMAEAIISNLKELHSYCEDIRGTYGSCEDSMLDVLQEDCGKYIYLLTSILD